MDAGICQDGRSGGMRRHKGPFKLRGREPAERGMRAYRVIKRFHISKNISLSSLSGWVLLKMDPFTLQTAEKILSDSVVVRVALAGHALPDAVSLQTFPVGSGGILDAAVTVKDEAFIWFLPPHSHVQGIQSKPRVDPAGKGIAYDLLETEVLHNGQIQPALAGRDVGDIAHPGLVRPVKGEVPLEQVRGDGMAVQGVGRGLVCAAAGGADACQTHLAVYPLAGTAKLRPQQVVETVQSHCRILLMQFYQTPF